MDQIKEQAQPVAWMMVNTTHLQNSKSLHWEPQTDWHATWDAVPLYTSPPPRQPLTNEEIKKKWSEALADTEGQTYLPLTEFARAIEAAHGIKGEA